MEDSRLELVEIVEEALSYFDYGSEVLTYTEDGNCGDMTPEDIELGRATIAYTGMQLLLQERMQKSGAHESDGGWVAMRKFQSEIYSELASMLGISGTTQGCIDEVKRLYGISSDKWNEDEEYRDNVAYFMSKFEEMYELEPENLPVTFI